MKISIGHLKTALLLVYLSMFLSLTVFASDHEKKVEFAFLPGDARIISHSASASRDTALIAYQVLPRVAVTTGGDVGFFGFRFAEMELRLGLFGMFELETAGPEPLNFLTVPAGTYLWRGLLGYSLAFSMEGFASRLLGQRGELEATLSFRHESEHYTGSAAVVEPLFQGVPHIGDFLMLDLAMRKAVNRLDIELRVQNKFFLPTSSDAYSFGPGADFILRFHAGEWLFPFWSVFGEYLFAKRTAGAREAFEDNFLVRTLLGVLVAGKRADLQVYMAADMGHGKGLLSYDKEIRIGWGIRVVLFKSGLGDNN
jgi:hypothetical protein